MSEANERSGILSDNTSGGANIISERDENGYDYDYENFTYFDDNETGEA